MQIPFILIPKPNQVKYVADFRITYPNGSQEVIEVKGMWTRAAKIKKKLMAHFYPQVKITYLE